MTASDTRCKMENVKCEEKTFVIRKGEDLSSIAKRLQKENLIRSALAFKILILKENLAGKIQAGSFSLNSSLTPKEISFLLTHGTQDIWLTFPEGWRKEEFSQRLKSNLENFDSSQFFQLVENHEGELFPDTYLIPKEASPSVIFNLFLKNFQKKFNEELIFLAEKSGLSQKQVLILASIVERETRQEEDRPIVAGILLKRWREDWPLQADATIQYEMGSRRCQGKEGQKCDWWKPVTKKDLNIDSPYNTYKYKGLPPTPICNPGLSSIKAVIFPKDSDYWFYLSDSSGKIHYAKKREEHNNKIKKYLLPEKYN